MIDRDKIIDLQKRIGQFDDMYAYETLFLMCFPVLTRFAYSFIKSRELSEEIASDVLIRIWNRREKLQGITDFRLYLYVSTRNTALNALKKQQQAHIFSLDDTAIWMKADEATPEQLFITAELMKKIQAAIQQLPAQCRLIYKLIKEDGLKYREAAELLHLSVKTIETQMSIAMKRLYAAVFHNSIKEPDRPVAKSESEKKNG
ncbi:MAG TPA: RNA polymerase sigma-70 factor [Chitinophagaceae bacterium]|nr:RNA polymerase sigma-70 factor [Chitinophagaceae bacterium]